MEYKNEIVSHHNYITESYFSATEKELNLFITLLYKYKFCKKTDTVVNYDEIKKYVGLKDGSYKEFEKVMIGLQETTIRIFIEKENKMLTRSPFPSIDFHRKEKIIKLKINEDLLPLVNELKDNFTKYSLNKFLELKGQYSKRIYQIIQRWLGLRERTIELDELKRYLDCETQTYKEWKHFNAQVLKKSVTEINKNTDLVISYEGIKRKEEGDKRASVKAIKFKFYRKQRDVLELEDFEITKDFEKAVIKAKRNIYVSKSWNKRVDSKLEKLLKEEGEKYTIEILKDLYDNLKKDVKTTLVQYINGIIKNKKLDLKDKEIKEKRIKNSKQNIQAKQSNEELEIQEKHKKKVEKTEQLIQKQEEEKKKPVVNLEEFKNSVILAVVGSQRFDLLPELEKLDTIVKIAMFIGKHTIKM